MRCFDSLQSLSMTRAGFTLIELSIVLVILGLIVGGIVGGQSLIHQARLQSVLREVNSLKTAINAFRLEYDALPGDFSEGHAYFDDGTNDVCGDADVDEMGCNGNGNGIIGDGGGHQGLAEIWRAWHHLVVADILQDTYAYPWATVPSCQYRVGITKFGLSGSYIIPTPNVPTSRSRDGNGYAIIHPVLNNGTTFNPQRIYGRGGHWLVLMHPPVGVAGSAPNIFGGSTQGAAVTPADAAAIDKKSDDGKPNSGNITASRYWSGTGPGNCTDPSISPSNMDTTSPTTDISYDVSNTGYACNPMFYLGD